ncbi:MAG: hypothetical protein LBD97_05300, partial [Bifidobacteriaceae bacterium]|nr:hypothetical protein [Bifidobacteriaceae bacterium]
LHLPLTVATRHLLGAAEFAAMRPGVRLVNTARGELVDGDALAQALRSGQVRAYSADVAAGEPPDPADPLLGAPNTMFTPHMAYLSQASARRYELDPARNLVAALRKKGALTR